MIREPESSAGRSRAGRAPAQEVGADLFPAADFLGWRYAPAGAWPACDLLAGALNESSEPWDDFIPTLG